MSITIGQRDFLAAIIPSEVANRANPYTAIGANSNTLAQGLTNSTNQVDNEQPPEPIVWDYGQNVTGARIRAVCSGIMDFYGTGRDDFLFRMEVYYGVTDVNDDVELDLIAASGIYDAIQAMKAPPVGNGIEIDKSALDSLPIDSVHYQSLNSFTDSEVPPDVSATDADLQFITGNSADAINFAVTKDWLSNQCNNIEVSLANLSQQFSDNSEISEADVIVLETELAVISEEFRSLVDSTAHATVVLDLAALAADIINADATKKLTLKSFYSGQSIVDFIDGA
jgi:hypothetical protein